MKIDPMKLIDKSNRIQRVLLKEISRQDRKSTNRRLRMIVELGKIKNLLSLYVRSRSVGKAAGEGK